MLYTTPLVNKINKNWWHIISGFRVRQEDHEVKAALPAEWDPEIGWLMIAWLIDWLIDDKKF